MKIDDAIFSDPAKLNFIDHFMHAGGGCASFRKAGLIEQPTSRNA
ncbi:hypothetical protein ABC347_14245 [Sphingomonas sp. 1P06PA]